MNELSSDQAFLDFLDTWMATLPTTSLAAWAQPPEATAILSVDLIKGFCSEGPLASPRVAALVEPATRLMRAAWQAGVPHILLLQDTHEPDAVEFRSYPPHCVRGTTQSQPVDEIASLPFFDRMVVIEKNSIQAGLNSGLNDWLEEHPDVDTFIVVGDCTDLCVYQLAMHLRLDANAYQLERRVIVPANCVDTYDLPVETAEQIGALPHPADFLHRVFLYHMALNGVTVLKSIEVK